MVIGTLPITVLHVTVLLALFVPVLFGDVYVVWQMSEYWKQDCKEVKGIHINFSFVMPYHGRTGTCV